MEKAAEQVDDTTSVVGRIQQILDHYGLNANSASKLLGYFNTSKLYKILQGSAPSFPTMVEMLKAWPEVSPEWLLLGEGPMLRTVAPVSSAVVRRAPGTGGLPAVNNGGVLVVTVDKDGDDNTELVPVAAQAGYALQHNEAVFVADLPRYRLPRFEGGKFRAFEVAGDSMEPMLNHNDIVVCSYLDNWRQLVPDDMYVVVMDEAVMLKRIRRRIDESTEEVLLFSDNPHRRPYPIDRADINEIWRVRGYISTYLPSAPDVTVERLWEVIGALGFDKGEVRRHLDENAPGNAPD